MNSATAREASWMGEQAARDERLLVERIAQGDRDALTDLYTRYGAILFRYLVQIIGDHGLAEEVLQDTLVAVWKGAAGFEARSAVQTWLFGIARRQAHNATRRKVLPRVGEAALEGVPSGEPDPEDALLARVQREELASAIQRLTPVHREILALIFDGGLSYGDAATVLEVPEGTVKSRLSNAKRALREILRARRGGSDE